VYYYYNPEVFERLKTLLSNFNILSEHRNNLEFWYENFTEDIKEALITIGFESFVAKQQSVTLEQFNKQLVVWFDAFKTLKFIHFLRDKYYQNLPLSEAILLANFNIE
jgi:hypothetical protein